MIIRRMLTLGLLALALSACASASGAAPTAGAAVPHTIAPESKLVGNTAPVDIPQVGQVAPDFQYTMPDGSTHTLSQLRGKKVLVNFWATWCAPCRSEMPDLQKALGETGDSVVVLGVNKAQELKEIAPFADLAQQAARRGEAPAHLGQDAPHDVEAVAAAGQRQRRLVAIFRRQLRHGGARDIGRIGEHQIVGPLGQRFEQIPLVKADPMRQAVVIDIRRQPGAASDPSRRTAPAHGRTLTPRSFRGDPGPVGLRCPGCRVR